MDFLFHSSYFNQTEKRQKAQLLVFSIFLSLSMYSAFLGIAYYAQFYNAIVLILISIFSLLAALILLKTPVKLKIPANISLGATNFLAFSCMYLSGGIHSPIVLWMIAPPITALLITNRLSSYIWAGITLTEVCVLIFIDYHKFKINSDYNPAFDDFFYFASFAGVMIIVFLISILFERMVHQSRVSVLELNKELMLKNEELNIQTEEISSQRDMLYEMTSEMKLRQTEIIELNEKLELKIQERTKELYNALKELDTFIYRSAHDIKGPLATISGLCYVAMFDVKDEKSANYLGKIQNQTQKTIHLIQRIAGISELKKVEITDKKIDFKLINLKISRYLSEEEDAQYVKLSIDIPDKEYEFYSDQNLIETIIIDLLDNSIKFRDSFKDHEAFAKLTVSIQDEMLHIRMEDNGLGIADNIRENLYDMFFKGTDKSKGSGLGLFIIKIAMEKLNGSISLNNHIKGKTIFDLQIPSLARNTDAE